jgi:PAS domain S-box-containing protein
LRGTVAAGAVAAIDGIEISAAGSCGTAAWTRKTVIVADITVDPRWVEHRALAAAHGLAACWSIPLQSTRQQVLGTFAIYYRTPRAPGPDEITAIERAAYLASVAIERHAAKTELAQSEARYRNLYNNTPSMQCSIDAHGFVDVSDYWLAVMGYCRDEVIGRPLASCSRRRRRDSCGRSASRTCSTGVAHNVEYQQVRKTGEVLDVLCRAPPSAMPPADRRRGSSLADTARKRLETSVRTRTRCSRRWRAVRPRQAAAASTPTSALLRGWSARCCWSSRMAATRAGLRARCRSRSARRSTG